MSCAMPRRRTPWLASTCASNLRFWPTFAWRCALQPGLEHRRAPSRRRSGPARPDTRARAAGTRPCRRRRTTCRPGCASIGSRPGGLGVEADQRRPSRASAGSRASSLLVAQREVLAALARLRRRRRAAAGAAAARGGGRVAPDLAQHGLQAEALEELRAASPRPASLPPQVAQADGQLHVALHREQLAPLRQPVERLAQVLADRAGNLAGMRHHLRRASRTAGSISPPSSGRPCRRRARCPPRRRSARGSRRSAPARTPNFCRTPSGSSFSFDMVLTSVTRSSTSCARSLSPVEMTQRQPLRLRLLGERGDDVVGLDAVDRQHRPAERRDRLLQRLDLRWRGPRASTAGSPCTRDRRRRGRSCPWRRTRRRAPWRRVSADEPLVAC